MKRIIAGIMTMLVMLLLTGTFAWAEAASDVWKMPYGGVDLTPPQSWTESGYYFEYGTDNHCSEDVYISSGVFYNGTEEDLDAVMEEYGSGQEFVTYANAHAYSVFYLVSAREALTPEEVLAETKAAVGEDPSIQLNEVGQTDGWRFYDLTADSLDLRPEPFPGTEETVKQLLADIPALYQDARFYQPIDGKGIREGNQLSFDTTDFNGNQVNSRELFSRNAYTLVNLWTSWCPYCVDEMPELEAMRGEFAAEHGGVIGIMLDGDEADKLETGKQIVEDTGVTFQVLTPTEDMKYQLPCTAYPTTIIVDANGVVVGEPIVGMQPQTYRDRMEELLAEVVNGGESVETEQHEEDLTQAEEQGYVVTVQDEDGTPVSGAVIQFCSDSLCMTDVTDEDGKARFDQEAGTYTVHILQAPEGYQENTEEYTAPEAPGVITISLEKNRQ